jgi:hypothetical protein
MMRTGLVLTLAGSIVLSACSFATTRPPKSGEPDDTCNTSEVGPVLDASWAVLEGIGTLLLIADYSSNSYSSDDKAPIVVGLGITGLFTGAAIYGFGNVRKCRNRNKDIEARAAEAEARQAQLPSARDAAWQMTKQAHAAAIAGDCPTAAALAEVVRGTDPDFYDGVLLRDAAIARCVGASPAGAPPGLQPPAAEQPEPPAAPAPSPAPPPPPPARPKGPSVPQAPDQELPVSPP